MTDNLGTRISQLILGYRLCRHQQLQFQGRSHVSEYVRWHPMQVRDVQLVLLMTTLIMLALDWRGIIVLIQRRRSKVAFTSDTTIAIKAPTTAPPTTSPLCCCQVDCRTGDPWWAGRGEDGATIERISNLPWRVTVAPVVAGCFKVKFVTNLRPLRTQSSCCLSQAKRVRLSFTSQPERTSIAWA